jgi:hypothetical protein
MSDPVPNTDLEGEGRADASRRTRTSVGEPIRSPSSRPAGLKPLPPKGLMPLPDASRSEGLALPPTYKQRTIQRNMIAPAPALPGEVYERSDLPPDIKEMLANQERMLRMLKDTMQSNTVRADTRKCRGAVVHVCLLPSLQLQLRAN